MITITVTLSFDEDDCLAIHQWRTRQGLSKDADTSSSLIVGALNGVGQPDYTILKVESRSE